MKARKPPEKSPEASDLPLALTMGDPAGIGPELTAQAWQVLHEKGHPFFWCGDARLLETVVPVRRIEAPSEAMEHFRRALPVLHIPCPVPVQAGRPDSRNASAVIASIRQAVEAVLAGEAGAVVTNPIAKHVLAEAGFPYPGHTEFLAALCGAQGRELMMLASPQLRVVLTSIHVSLQKAINALDGARIEEVARVTHAALQRDFGIASPRLAVAGLNPHAGENGLMGLEEKEIIAPAVARLREAGLNVIGPLPPDTMFSAGWRNRYDAALCLYHDQGLIPLKTLAMDEGVNVTLGLPIIRTSPDHGTAFDIARDMGRDMARSSAHGPSEASPASLLAALEMAADMVRRRAESLESAPPRPELN